MINTVIFQEENTGCMILRMSANDLNFMPRSGDEVEINEELYVVISVLTKIKPLSNVDYIITLSRCESVFANGRQFVGIFKKQLARTAALESQQ